MQLAPGIHRIEAPLGDRYVALYLVEGDNGSLLVDTGLHDSIGSTLLPYLHSIDHDASRIRYVVNTHADFDHVGGNSAIHAANPDIAILCGERDRPMINDLELMIDDRYGEFRTEHGFDETDDTKTFIRDVAHPAPVAVGLTGGEHIDLGGRVVEIMHTPGHSPGHLSVYDPQSRSAMIGDAVLWNSVLTASGEAAFPPTYRDPNAYRATIAALSARKIDTLLTSHYAVRRGAAVGEFLDVSAGYADTVEQVVLDTVTDATEPVSLMDVIHISAGRFGPWKGAAADYLVYPVLGHLEVLEQLGRVVRAAPNSAGHVTWQTV
jgi:glyoxylase-like metal-dependent hydrolase (beta-lactamase superfamily II)